MRRDYFFDRWSLIASSRDQRGHDLRSQQQDESLLPPRSESCDFCPGNESRTPASVLQIPADDGRPPEEWQLRVFRNLFPILPADDDAATRTASAWGEVSRYFVARPSNGFHEVVVESPCHNLTPGGFTTGDWAHALFAYRERIAALEAEPGIAWVHVFKNQGAAAGASREHGHSQIIALPLLPARIQVKSDHAHEADCGYCRVSRAEAGGPRFVAGNQDFVAFCPFAPGWEHEVWITARAHLPRLDSLDGECLASLAALLRPVVQAVELVSPAYNVMFFSGPPRRDFHLHVEITPRPNGAMKAGFELGTNFSVLRTSPEDSAAIYRALISGTGTN